MTLKPFVVVVLTAQVNRNWLGWVTTQAAEAVRGMPTSEKQATASAGKADRRGANGERNRLPAGAAIIDRKSFRAWAECLPAQALAKLKPLDPTPAPISRCPPEHLALSDPRFPLRRK